MTARPPCQRSSYCTFCIARRREKCQVCLGGCSELHVDEPTCSIKSGETTLREGELFTLDGNEGLFRAGATQIKTAYPEQLLARLDGLRRRGPRA